MVAEEQLNALKNVLTGSGPLPAAPSALFVAKSIGGNSIPNAQPKLNDKAQPGSAASAEAQSNENILEASPLSKAPATAAAGPPNMV